MTIFVLDGRQMTGRESAHEYIARALPLPAYYGKNLDALDDCLSELPKNAVLCMTSGDAVLNALGTYGEKLLSVFVNASQAGYCQFIRL